MSQASNAPSSLPEHAASATMPVTASGDADSLAALITAALAYLAQHMQTACQRSGALAAMLLERLANDTRADVHLRQHARQLAEILEADPQLAAFDEADAIKARTPAARLASSASTPQEHPR